jgi:hypothetical protein
MLKGVESEGKKYWYVQSSKPILTLKIKVYNLGAYAARAD